MTHEAPLLGKHILVVEDEYLVARELADMVENMGAALAGMTSTVHESLAAADAAPDGALVDINLRDGKSYDVVDKLVANGVPVVLTTGYDAAILPDHMSALPRLTKPFDPAQFRAITLAAFAAPR